MDNLELMKQEISNLAKEKKEEFEKVSDYIFANPELAFKEYKSQEALCKLLESHGFVVKRGIAEMPTSFEAVFDSGKPGKTVALMGEYDCLPEIGHGCGHNLIGTSAAGAGIVLKEVMEKHEIGGVLKVLGTPAEEKGSGKAIMVRHGVFEGIDAALLMHPCDESMPDDISFAAITLEFTFKGKPAHAAACPCGVAHNTITDEAKAVFNIRSLEYDYMMEMVDAIRDCAKGAAIATRTEVEERQLDEVIKDVRNDKKLVQYVRKNMDFIGEEYIERDLTQGIGSTDVGNVTHEIPAIQFYVKLKEHVGTHTKEFAVAAGGEEGKRNLHASVQLLAMSALDVLSE